MRNIVATASDILLGLSLFSIHLALSHGNLRELVAYFDAVFQLSFDIFHRRKPRGIQFNAIEFRNPHAEFSFGILERVGIVDESRANRSFFFKSGHQVLRVEVGRTRLEVQHFDTVSVDLVEFLIKRVDTLAHQVMNSAFVAVVQKNGAVFSQIRIRIGHLRFVMRTVSRTFAKSLRSHAKFKVMLCKAEAIEFVTQLKLVPQFRVARGRNVYTFLRTLITGVIISRLDEGFPSQRGGKQRCCNKQRYKSGFFHKSNYSEMVTISPKRNEFSAGIVIMTSRP